MNALNAYLPVGPSSVDHSRSVSIGGTTNNITVNSPDPQSAAAMVSSVAGFPASASSTFLSRIACELAPVKPIRAD